MARLKQGILIFSIAVLMATGIAAADTVPLLTGEVFSRQAQDIIVPLTSKYRVTISMMAVEGSEVDTGQTVVEFDGSEAATQLEQQREAMRAQTAVAERDIARLEKEVSQARFAVDQAEVSLELAQLRADIPKGLIGALQHSENQLVLEKAIKALENGKKQRAEKNSSLKARQEQLALDIQKAELMENWWSEMLDAFSIEARQAGYVIHDSNPWTGVKYQEGDTVRTSFRVAQVADTSDLAIKVWINGVDRPKISVDSPVWIILDALPANQQKGTLAAISDSTTTRPEWGKATYFEGVVNFESKPADGILPGMSVLVEPLR